MGVLGCGVLYVVRAMWRCWVDNTDNRIGKGDEYGQQQYDHGFAVAGEAELSEHIGDERCPRGENDRCRDETQRSDQRKPSPLTADCRLNDSAEDQSQCKVQSNKEIDGHHDAKVQVIGVRGEDALLRLSDTDNAPYVEDERHHGEKPKPIASSRTPV